MYLILDLSKVNLCKVDAANIVVVGCFVVDLAVSEVYRRGPLRCTWEALLIGVLRGNRNIKVVQYMKSLYYSVESCCPDRRSGLKECGADEP